MVYFILYILNIMGIQAYSTEPSQSQIYRENSCIQTSHAEVFLGKWPLQGDEKILDIGCGDGRITDLIAKKVPLGMVKGIDLSPQMIELATSSFPELLFEEVDALEYHDDTKYDIVTVLSTLHWFTDQRAIFEKMKSLLKPDGKIFILAYSPVDAYWKPMEEGVFDEKWRPFFTKKPFYCQLPKELLKREMDKGGFSILSFDAIADIAVFNGKEGFINHIHGFLPHLKNLPTEHHEELLNDIGARFLEWNTLDQDGCTRQAYETYEIILNVTPP